MSITKLPNGRYRAQVYDRNTGKTISAAKILGGPASYATKREAKAAREKAREKLGTADPASEVTVAQFRDRWLTDPLFHARWKKGADGPTAKHNAERTKHFADLYGTVALRALGTQVGDEIVGEYLAGGRRNGTVMALRAMCNAAMSAKAGRLLERNPFAALGIEKSKGNREKQPPSQQQMENMITLARELTPPSFAAYFEFACVSGARPSELDALRPEWIDLEAGEVHLREQWNAKTRTFTDPKYGPYTIALVGRARDVLTGLKRSQGDENFVFCTLRGTHYTPSSRTHHWNRVRAAAGLGDVSLYLATRHYFGWYAVNVLELDTAIVAEQLGHRDGGKLVEQLYGHPDKSIRRRKLRESFDRHGQVRPLRVVRDDAG